jgi:hypothetical protein
MGKSFDKIWPYAFGAAMLTVVVIFGPKFIKREDGFDPRPGAAPAAAPLAAASNGATLHGNTAPQIPSDLPGNLKPIIKGKPLIALYRIVAERLIDKLKPPSLQPTYREYERLLMNTAGALYTNLGLTLPDGCVIPQDVPSGWVESPHFDTMRDYGYLREIHTTNLAYFKQIESRLFDDYSTKTIAVLMEQFADATKYRVPGDEATLHLIKAVYGDDFVEDYAKGHQPREQRSRTALQIPAKSIQQAEADVSSVWRTEFSDPELTAVKDYIIQRDLGGKLRDDFYRSNMEEAEKGLMESTILGYRISKIHTLTTDLVAAYGATFNNAANKH